MDKTRVHLTSPVDIDAIEALPHNGAMQFGGSGWGDPHLTESDFRMLSEFVARRADVQLRAFGLDARDDLEFLRFFPDLRQFSIDNSYQLERFDGLRHLSAELESLCVGNTRRSLSLKFLERFSGLRQLWLEGQKSGIESVSKLVQLERLTLSSITLPDLSLLLPLKKLRHFEIYLGGTKDLGLLPQIGSFRKLGLYMIKGLTDVSSISELHHLELLILNTLNRLSHLPSFKSLTKLKRVELTNLKSMTDLSPLLDAVSLEELVVEKSKHLTPDHFECLKKHSSLKRLSAHFGRKSADDAVKAMFDLPAVLD